MKPTLIHITTHDLKEAEALSTHLVKNKLVSCAWIVPSIHSVYTWKGKLYHDKEALVIAKTFDTKFKKIEVAIKKQHSYEVPAIVAVQITNASKEYLDWSLEALK